MYRWGTNSYYCYSNCILVLVNVLVPHLLRDLFFGVFCLFFFSNPAQNVWSNCSDVNYWRPPRADVWLMGQQLEWAGWARVCVCVFTCDIHRLALSDGGSGAPHSLQGVPCLPAGVCSRQTEGCLCTPARKLLLTLTQTHRQTRNTPPHPAELRDGCGCCGGWGFRGVGTLCSSRTPLMHNSCIHSSSDFDISQGI